MDFDDNGNDIHTSLQRCYILLQSVFIAGKYLFFMFVKNVETYQVVSR